MTIPRSANVLHTAMRTHLAFKFAVALLGCHVASGLSPGPVPKVALRTIRPHAARQSLLRMEEYTEVQQLRAEAEAPFAQVRLFILPVLFAAAGISTYFAATGLLASTLGVRDPSPTGVQDLAIDLGSMVVAGYLWRREVQVRESKLKRIAFGSALAALRLSPLVPDAARTGLRPGVGVSLSDLRRGRGQARRVVLVCATEDTLTACRHAAAPTLYATLALSSFHCCLRVPPSSLSRVDRPLRRVCPGFSPRGVRLSRRASRRIRQSREGSAGPSVPCHAASPCGRLPRSQRDPCRGAASGCYIHL